MFLGVLILVVISVALLVLYAKSELRVWGYVDRKRIALFALYDLVIIVIYAIYISNL